LIESLSPLALRDWLRDASRTPPLLLDVRDPWEYALCHIADARLLPLTTLAQRWNELPMEGALVMVCHHGLRSQQAARVLESAGFSRLYNLNGGIARWAAEVDAAMPRY
jgi:rhodanese-related sulfurtransferase